MRQFVHLRYPFSHVNQLFRLITRFDPLIIPLFMPIGKIASHAHAEDSCVRRSCCGLLWDLLKYFPFAWLMTIAHLFVINFLSLSTVLCTIHHKEIVNRRPKLHVFLTYPKTLHYYQAL